MTETSCQFVAQIVPAHVFSKKDTKSTKLGILLNRNLRVLRDLRGELCQNLGSVFAMPFDSQALFANLAERERVHGHHSPEGQAVRTLGRVLDGWSSGNLSGADVVVICGQAMEDWLKRRLNLSPWSAQTLTSLLPAALAANLLQPSDAERLQILHRYRAELATRVFTSTEIEAVLETTIEIVERHWS